MTDTRPCWKCVGTGEGDHNVEDVTKCEVCGGSGRLPGVVHAESPEVKRRKANYVGAPAIFKLEMYCQKLNQAFDCFGCYLVGSAVERPDWRDVDVRMIMADDEFDALFPASRSKHCRWEFDPRWLILTTSISAQMSEFTGLPIDFQIQPQTHANNRHSKEKGGTERHALGMYFDIRKEDDRGVELPEADKNEDEWKYAKAGVTPGWDRLEVYETAKKRNDVVEVNVDEGWVSLVDGTRTYGSFEIRETPRSNYSGGRS